MFGQTGGFGSTGGGFGQQPQQGQQTGGLFGQTSTGFGQPQQQTGGMFGQTQQPGQTGGLFGQPAQPAQQQSTGLFGGSTPAQSNAFGSTGGAFGSGSTGTFGQQQQPRPTFGASSTTGGGLFGGAAAGGSTFGGSTGFGAANNAAPATGGGLFGSTSTGFGAKPATTGFGAPAASTGNTGGLFGAKPAGTGLFGAAAPAGAPGPVTNGTATAAYQPVKEKDGNTNNYTVYQTITCMDPYKGASLEELRLQDYQQNRKTAPPPGTNPFGAGSSSGGMFGQPAQQPSTGLFGAAQPASTGFGAGASTGLFGQSAQPAGSTAFGQPQQSTGFGAPAASTGLFGSNTQSTGTGLFGQQSQQQPQQQSGGLFGQQNQQAGGLFGQSGSTGTTGGLFGSNTGASTTGGGLFGQQQQPAQPAASGAFSFGANNQNQAKPAFGGFGTGSTTSSTFGQPAATGASTGFGFGQNNQQAQQPQATQQASTGFGFGAQPAATAPQSGGLFGSQSQQQPQQSGGLFGSKPAGGLFGSTTGTTNTFGAPSQTQGQTGGGLFGAAAQPAQPAGQQPSTGLFGSTGSNTFGAAKPGGLFGQPAQTGNTGGGLFGNNSTNQSTGFGQPAAQPTTGLFGSTNQQTGGGLFGNLGASQQGQQNQTGGLFGAKPNNTGSGLFGQSGTGSTLGASTGGSGLFGSSFGGGAQQQNNQNLGGSLFGNSSTNQLQQSQSQPPVNIDVNNPYGANGMFSVPPSFQPINVSTGPKTLPPLSSSLRPAPSAGKMTPRFRGISTPARAASTLPQSSILGASTASNGSPARNLFSTPPPDTLSPAAFTPRQGVKKLVLHRKTDSLSLSSAVANRTPQISRSILNPEADHDGTSVNGSVMGNTLPGSRQASVARTQNEDTATEKEHRRADFSRKIDLEDYSHGDYYTIPELSELYNASNEDLSSVEDFVVGRKGYGRLTYLEPVDLGTKHTLNRICGDLVLFKDGKCEVYPQSADERPPGEGLNHRAEISLEDCWPRNKETQQPITDPKHPKQRARERALRHVPDTTFQSYNPSTGVWVFTVEHFTLYGIPEEDDSDDEEGEMDAQEDIILNDNGKRERSAEYERYGSLDGGETAGSPSEIDRSSVASSQVDDDASEYAPSSIQQPVEITVRQRDLIFTGMYGTPQPDDLEMTPRPNKKRLQFFRKAEKDIDGEVDGGDVDRSFFGATRTAPSKERNEWKLKRIESKDAVTVGEEGAFLDAGLALGRSQRVTLASTGHAIRLRQNQVVSSSRIDSKDATEEREVMIKLLDFQLQRTNFIDEKGVPIAETDTTVRFKDIVDLFRGDGRYEAELWRLGRALFDEIPTLANREVAGQVRVDAESLVRKNAVSDWLADHLAPIVDREVNAKDSSPETVFRLLVANQVSRATSVAMDGGDLRLATLVAQAGSGPEFKATMEQQLDVWRKQDVDAHIDVSYRRVYALLAGIVDVVEGGPLAEQVEMSRGLSWLQALGLHLWFGTPLEQPLPDVINNFRAHLDSEHPPAKPLVTDTETEDAMFGLMKVCMEQSTPASCLAGSATYGKAPTDVRLQWHLLDLLTNVFGFGTSEEHVMESVRTFDRLSIDYASQLERDGLWEYAVFVSLHLDKESSRLKAVKEVLGRHAAELTDKEEILQRMSVPREWLAEARANLYASQGNVYSEFLSCKEAGLMDRAHNIVIQRLAPEVVLREDVGLLRKLLAGLEDARVADWHKGGQVLLQYGDLCERTKDLLSASSDASEQLTEIVQRIPTLLENLERFYADDRSIELQQLVCRTHMLAKVQKVATALASQRMMTMPPLSRSLPEGDRLQVMQSASRDRLQRRLEALSA